MKRKTRDAKNAFLVKVVAEKNNKSTRSVERYIKGDIDNDEVLADLDDLKRAIDTVIDAYKTNKLIQAVNELVPIN